MPNATAQRRDELPLQLRMAPIATIDKAARTVDVEWTKGSPVRRYDWRFDRYYIEELSLAPGAIRMERLQSGRAPLLDSHSSWDLRSVIGVVERAWDERSQKLARVRFSKREEVEPIFRDVEDGILGNVSVGYRVYKMEMRPPEPGETDWRYFAIDWEPYELSLVAIGADPGAGVRSDGTPPTDGRPTFPCEFSEPAQQRQLELDVPNPAAVAAGHSSTSTTRKEPHMTTAATGQPTAPAADLNAGAATQEQTRASQEAGAKAERERVREIRSRCGAAGLSREFEDTLINDAVPLQDAYARIIDEVAKQQKATPNATRVSVVEDARIKLRAAVAAALFHRVHPTGQLPDNGASDFRHMSLIRMAEEVLSQEGIRVRGMSKMEIAERSLHSTSDFPNILADTMNKRLRAAYVENAPSYTRWARRAPNAPDFKTITVAQLSGAPNLAKVLEGGEFKRGSMSDGKETYQVMTYGRIIGISRQAIVNDDLNSFDRIPMAIAGAARRFENRTVYDVLTGNAALADTGNLFNATAVSTAGGHANLGTGTGSALSTGSLATARTAMRKQKGLQSEELNIAPTFLIGPVDLEQTMYQLTSNQFVPATATGVNEFRQGGRTALEPIVEAYLSAASTTAWYLAADTGQVDTVEYCYLDGSEGLYLENRIGFDVDGMEIKARLDFAAAPIDFRGLYKANGA